MNEVKINLTVRNSPALWRIISELILYQPLMKKTDLVEAAVEYALKSKPDWKKLASLKPETECSTMEGSPELIQVRVNSSGWSAVSEEIKRSFQPPLKSLRSIYALKLILLNYLDFLTMVNSGEGSCEPDSAEEKSAEEDIDAPEMAAILCSMILENSPLLEPIKKIMYKYKEGEAHENN